MTRWRIVDVVVAVHSDARALAPPQRFSDTVLDLMATGSNGIDPVEVVLWTDTQRAGRDGQIIAEMGAVLRPIGVGGPRTAEVDALARRLDCVHQDDLRQLLIDRPAAFVLLGSMAGAEQQDIAAAVSQGTTVIALEPVSALLEGHRSFGKQAQGEAEEPPSPEAPPGRILASPSFESSVGWTDAANPLEVLGTPQLTSFTSFGCIDDASLMARLMDAWRSVLSLLDLPLSIDASLSGPLSQAPGDLRGLTGHLAAHGRLANGGSVLLQVSDRGGAHLRTLDLISSKGRLAVSDVHYQLYDTTGELMDQNKPAAEQATFVKLVVDHWHKILRDSALPTAAQRDRAERIERHALACGLACLLSARTGEPESPAKLMKLQR